MDKFQEIFTDKPENEYLEKVIFLSDAPAIGIVGAVSKEVYALMTTKDLLAMLKASLPAEALTGLGWGKTIQYELDAKCKFEITFTAEKTIKIELTRIAQEKKEKVEEQVVKKQEVAAVDPEILDDLMQADALIYYSEQGSEPKELAEMVTKAGYLVKISKDKNACMQALNYKDFPIVGLFIEDNVFADPVFALLRRTLMVNRRSQFSFLVTNNIESGNQDTAYSFSVSLVLEPSAIKDFETYFNKNFQLWKRVIDPFVEILSVKD